MTDIPSLRSIANRAFVLVFIKCLKMHLDLSSREIHSDSTISHQDLTNIGRDLWKFYSLSRLNKPRESSTDRVIIEILNYVDENIQKCELGLFHKSEFINQVKCLANRLRALLVSNSQHFSTQW